MTGAVTRDELEKHCVSGDIPPGNLRSRPARTPLVGLGSPSQVSKL